MTNRGRRGDRERRRRQQQTPRRRPSGSAEDQDLFQAIRAAMRTGEPLDLLGIISGFLEVTDSRRASPFDPESAPISLDQLLETFVDTPFAETTGALTVLQALIADEFTAARIGRVLEMRSHPLPGWLSVLGQARIEPDVWLLTHVLGDGDDYLFGVTLPSGHALSVLVYVDHNLGTVVKDAFVVPDQVEDLALNLGRTMPDPDQSLTRTDPATARAVIEDAIMLGSRMYPPLESDSWPMCRPIVEWMLRMLPGGGVAPDRTEWTDADKDALADEFFAGPFGAPIDRRDERDLLGSLLWFGTDYATGDPLRWSPVTVELLLADWLPRKVIAEPRYLAKAPALLRAFIRHAHDRLGIRASLTEETLAAVDRYEPGYQQSILGGRPQDSMALMAGMLGDTTYDGSDDFLLDRLADRVGGRAALADLDDEPLPDEPFEWAGIPEDIQPVVRRVLELCDHCADKLLDVEHRTAMRRFLHRAAADDPAIYRRKASLERGAAAIAWVISRANDTAGPYPAKISVSELLASFGITGSVSQRAEPLLKANGVDPYHQFGRMALGTADLLTAATRRKIISTRERWLDV